MRNLIAGLAAVTALTSAPAQAELVTTSESGFVSRHTALVKGTPGAAWSGVIAPSSWWQDQHTFSGDAENLTLDARANGCFCESLQTGEDRDTPGNVRHMVVLLSDPGRALRLSGGLGPLQSEAVNGVLTITMKAEGDATRVVFEYVVGGYMRYPVETIGPAVDRVIGAQLVGLARLLGPANSASRSVTPAADPDAQPDPDSETRPVADADEGGGLGEDFLDEGPTPETSQSGDRDAAIGGRDEGERGDDTSGEDVTEIETDETYSR